MANAPEKHARLSPSAAERWWNCPGSIAATEHVPRKDTVYTTEGTVAHAIAADALIHNWNDEKLWTLLGEVREEGGFEHEVTNEMLEAVWQYVEYVRSFLEPGDFLVVEKLVDLTFVHPDMFGTGDCVIIKPFDQLHFFDLKYGKGKKVDVYKNKQLMTYFTGWFFSEDVTHGTIHICQTRLEDGISHYDITRDEIIAFRVQLEAKAKEASRAGAPCIAGDWCHQTFCPIRATCPAVIDKAKELVANDFETVPAVQSLTLDQIVKVLDHADFITAWLKEVHAYASELAQQGEQIPGYKLVRKYGDRTWLSEDAVIADFADTFGDRLYEAPKLKSPAQLEKVIGKGKLDDYIIKPDRGEALVKETAKAKKITKKKVTAKQEFGEQP